MGEDRERSQCFTIIPPAVVVVVVVVVVVGVCACVCVCIRVCIHVCACSLSDLTVSPSSFRYTKHFIGRTWNGDGLLNVLEPRLKLASFKKPKYTRKNAPWMVLRKGRQSSKSFQAVLDDVGNTWEETPDSDDAGNGGDGSEDGGNDDDGGGETKGDGGG